MVDISMRLNARDWFRNDKPVVAIPLEDLNRDIGIERSTGKIHDSAVRLVSLFVYLQYWDITNNLYNIQDDAINHTKGNHLPIKIETDVIKAQL